MECEDCFNFTVTSYKLFKKEYILVNRIQYFFEIFVHFFKALHYFFHKSIPQYLLNVIFTGYIQLRYFINLFQVSRFEFNDIFVVEGVQVSGAKIVFNVFN